VNAEGSAGHIHLGLTTALNETADCELEVEDGMVTTGRDQIRFPDNTSCVEDDSPRGDGGMYCKVEYSDGSKLEMTMAPDGNGTETYTDTSGTVELTGTFDDQSFDDFTYADDSTEQIDTDYWDDSWDDLWDDSSSSSDEVKVKRHTSRSPSHNHTSHTPSS
jgi:hypothetical protein